MTTINKMTINVGMDGDAFKPDKWVETSRILRKIAGELDALHLPVTVIDLNGNAAGTIIYDVVMA